MSACVACGAEFQCGMVDTDTPEPCWCTRLPPLPAEQIGPLRWCRKAVRRYTDQFVQRVDPRGRTYYWLAGEVANDLDAEVAGPAAWPTDVAHVAAGGVSLTPLQPELFWRGDTAALPQLGP